MSEKRLSAGRKRAGSSSANRKSSFEGEEIEDLVAPIVVASDDKKDI